MTTSIFVGLACDYCVHVLQVHRHSGGSLHSTLQRAGPSLYGAALTTTTAALPLLLCSIVPFRQVGEFIAVFTLMSLAVALTLVATLLSREPKRDDDEMVLAASFLDLAAVSPAPTRPETPRQPISGPAPGLRENGGNCSIHVDGRGAGTSSSSSANPEVELDAFNARVRAKKQREEDEESESTTRASTPRIRGGAGSNATAPNNVLLGPAPTRENGTHPPVPGHDAHLIIEANRLANRSTTPPRNFCDTVVSSHVV